MAETYNVTPENSPVTNVTLNADDVMNIYNGGTATATTIHDGGYLNVFSGGMADQTNVSAWMDILDGGVANNTTIQGNGWVTVSSGGVANTVLVSSGGLIDISSDGMVKDATVNANGELYISGKVTGQITFADGAVVSSYEGGIIDFDISEFSPGNTALLNKLSILKGARDYTLTVDGSQATGKYTLAGGVPTFNKSITVVDTLGTELGTISVAGGETDIGGVKYKLALTDSVLTVTIGDGGASKIITGDITDETRNVPSGWTALNVNVNSDGKLNVLNGGAASDTTVNSKGRMYISEGGAASNTTVNNSGYLYVSTGGAASDTTVNSGGYLLVSEGGVASDTTVNSGGYLLVSEGGAASDTTVNSGGYLYVFSGGVVSNTTTDYAADIESGGVASDITILENGWVTVSSGASADNITLLSAAYLRVESGGTATNIVWTPGLGGSVEFRSGGYVTFATKYSGVYLGSGGTLLSNTTVMDGKTVDKDSEMWVMDNGVATNTTADHGNVFVWSGGMASNTTLVNYGRLLVSSGGSADSTTVNSGCYLHANFGGVVSNTTLDKGYFWVGEGGSADTIIVNGGGLTVYSGGTATNIIWTPGSGGGVTVEAGASATFVNKYSGVYLGSGGNLLENAAVMDGKTVDKDSEMWVMDGGKATNTTVDRGNVYVCSNGVASDTTVNNYGFLYVSNGGVADNTTLTVGRLRVYFGGTASNTTVDSGVIYVEDGGVANNVTINVNGSMYVSSGGTATGIVWTPFEGAIYVKDGAYVTFATKYSGIYFGSDGKLLESAAAMDGKKVDDGCEMYVMDGGLATNTTVDHGDVYVWSGGMASNTTLVNYGELYVSNGGVASDTTINSKGYLYVSSGGMVYETTANSDGRITVESGGTANGATVNADGRIVIYSGGTASGATVNANGSMNIYSGGKATGQMNFADGAVVSSYEGGIIDFDISEFSPGNAALLNKLSILKGARDYTLTVDGSQATGKYTLAGGVPTFNKSITVVDTLGTELGMIDIGDDLSIGGVKYTLALDGSNLTVTVKGIEADLTGDLNTKYDLAAGMVASGVNVNSDGKLDVNEDAFAGKITVNSGGKLDVDSGGAAEIVTVNPGGKLNIYSGGTAHLVRENGGYVLDLEDADVTFAPNAFTGLALGQWDSATVHSGTTATDTTVASGGWLDVFAGGSAAGIVAADGARLDLTVAPDTYAQGTYAGSAFEIADGAVTGYAVHSGCYLYVSGGGVASNTVIKDDGWLRVSSGGVAKDTTLEDGGGLSIREGGSAAGIVAAEGATLFLTVAPDTYAQGTYAGSAFEFGSSVTGITLQPHVHIYIGSGGTAGEITVEQGGQLIVSSGGTAVDVTVNPGGNLYVFSGGSAHLIKEDGGYVQVPDGADVTFVPNTIAGLVFSSAATIHSGTTAIHTTMVTGGYLSVYSGGIVSDTTINAGTVMLEGGIATDTTVNEGTLQINSGAGTGTTVNSGGTLDLYKHNNIACDTTVNAGGRLYVTTGNTVNGLVVNSGGSADLMGTLTGKATFETGAIVMMSAPLTVDFDLTQTTPDADPLVNDLSFVMGTNTTYTLTVDGTEATGTYNLAGNVATFGKYITLMDVSGEDYGYLTIGGTVSNKYAYYTLAISDSTLTVDIVSKAASDTTPPTVTNITASTTAPTNQNVTVTADFNDNVALKSKLYRIDDGAWTDYVDGVVVTENATVYFKAVDTSGNECKPKFITIDNIDKVKPTITDITPNTTAPATSVTVTANFADDVDLALSQYKVGLGDWTDYTTGVTVTENTTIYFKAVDTAGNEATDQYEVTNIETIVPDTTKPVVSNVVASITAPTNQNVTVTAEFSDNVAVASKLYKIGDGAWTDYTTGVTMTGNGTVYFKAIDTSSNESEVVNYAVTNIDKIPPTKPVASANVTAPTNGSVTVTATFSEDTVLKEYSLNGTDWGAYPGGIKFDDNGTIYFRGTDAVGNVSELESYAVSNIDKIPPAKPTASADITTTTSGNVTVTAVFSEDTAVKEYSTDGLVWEIYAAPLVFSTNGKAYFRGTDAAGNVSAIISYEVTNIQPVTPDNKPDSGWNDYLYDKNKGWNTEANITNFATNTIVGNGEIWLDVPGTIDFEGMHNMFGNDGTNIDTGDVGKITAPIAAKVSFSIKSSANGTFYIYEDGLDKNKNRKQITVGKVTVKNGKVATLNNICLANNGKYYAAMTAKNVKKAGTQGIYNVTVIDSTIFVDADDGWNKEPTNKQVVDNPVVIERGMKTVKLDNTAMIDSGDYNNFVGFSDEKDYAKLELASTAYLSFDLAANGNAKFTLFKRAKNSGTMTKVGGVTTLKTKNGVQVSKSTKAQLLEVNDKYEYFILMESKDAAKGGSAYYNVNVNTVATRFFDSADGGENNWLFNKKQNEYNDDANLRSNTISSPGENAVILDNNPIGDNAFKNFVGYQDPSDYAKIVLTQNGSLTFKITALADVTFEIWQKDTDKKGKNVLNSLQKKTTVKVKDYAVGASATTDVLTLEAGDYYISVTAKSTKANEKGSAFYNVTAMFSPSGSVSDSLAMPEISDSLGISDSLSFVQYGTDALADVSASALSELNDKSAWQNIASLA